MKTSEDRFVQVGLLLDFYESVISKKQFDTLDMYYNKDMSLSEIGENLGITRQGVYEILKRGEEKLFQLEDKLHCYKLSVTCDDLRNALQRISDLQSDTDVCEACKVASEALKKCDIPLSVDKTVII